MPIVTRNIVGCIFFAVTFLGRSASAAPVDPNSACSKETLIFQECNQQYAVQRRDCLEAEIAKFKNCSALIETLNKRLIDELKAKGKTKIDALKTEKAVDLQTLQIAQRVLDEHRSDMKTTMVRFVKFMKKFESEYRASETSTVERLKTIIQKASDTKNNLAMVEIRFSAETLLKEEDAQSNEYGRFSESYVSEFREKAARFRERMKPYSEFVRKNALAGSLPTYEEEIALAKSVGDYAKARISKLNDSITALVQQIDAKERVLTRNKINKDIEAMLSKSEALGKESEFFRKVADLVKEAFHTTASAKDPFYEYLGAKFKAVHKFLTLRTLCSPESLARPENAWLGMGCRLFNEYLPTAEGDLKSDYARLIKAHLTDLEFVHPKLKGAAEIRAALESGNLERAIDLQDRLLQEIDSGKGNLKEEL